jgi:putative ABC transport system substrate-binding protein
MQFDRLKRRSFITLLGGAAAWPLAASGQQPQRTRRIGILLAVSERELEYQAGLAALVQALGRFGWIEGRNIDIFTKWAGSDPATIRTNTEQLVALAPDIIVTSGDSPMAPLLATTRSVPIVFNNVTDPVGAGFVESLAEPGGNATGFLRFEYTLAGIWLDLLRQIAPGIRRVAVLRDSSISAGIGQFAVIQSVAPSVGIDIRAIHLLDATEIERNIASFARNPNGGLILTAGARALAHSELIIALAARYKLPAVYYRRFFTDRGGLIAYGFDFMQQFRDTAGYVNRILKGDKPADLPVQAPTKYELVINLKTAKALGLEVPPMLLARANEVIE